MTRLPFVEPRICLPTVLDCAPGASGGVVDPLPEVSRRSSLKVMSVDRVPMGAVLQGNCAVERRRRDDLPLLFSAERWKRLFGELGYALGEETRLPTISEGWSAGLLGQDKRASPPAAR